MKVRVNKFLENLCFADKCYRKAVLMIASLCLLFSPVLCAETIQEKTGEISQYGMTWKFDKEYPYGTFANGDYWVVGPVTITAITPDVITTTNADGSIADVLNGWEVNPGTTVQGFDSRSGHFDKNLIPTLPYLANPGESIVKSIHRVQENCSLHRPCLKTAAVLTILSEIPPNNGTTVFRPPFVGNDKPLYSTNSIRMNLLPSLESVEQTMPLDDIFERFRKVRLDHIGGVSGRATRPQENMADYAGTIGQNEADAALRLMLNDPIEERKPALYAYLQYGIDLHYMVLNGQTWPAGGGEQPAHLLPYVFTAVLLDNTEMKNRIRAVDFFYHDMMVSFGRDGRALWGREVVEKTYWGPLVGRNGSKTARDPYQYIDGYIPGRGYDFCCVAMPFKGAALAFELLPTMKEVWNNSAFFEYVDRWVNSGAWTRPDPCAPAVGKCVHSEIAETNGKSCTTANEFSVCKNSDTKSKGVCYADDEDWNANYMKTFGPDGKGGCILDNDTSDGTGRFPERHGAAKDDGLRFTHFQNNMWSIYKGNHVPPVLDEEAPSIPGNLSVISVKHTAVTFSWSASTDNQGVREYSIFRDQQYLGTTAETFYIDNTVIPATIYQYTVKAVDLSNNSSGFQATPLVVTTPNLSSDFTGIWKFDEGVGTTTINSATDSHHGQLQGSLLWESAGYQGSALRFDGNDDRLSIGTVDFTGEALTIAAWIQPTAFNSADGRIISKASGVQSNDHYWMMSTYGNKLRVRLKTNGSTDTFIASQSNLEIGKWTHVAFMYDGSRVVIYQDGVMVGEFAKTGFIDPDPTVFAAIGNQPENAGNAAFFGLIDDVNIYTRALSHLEIQNLAW